MEAIEYLIINGLGNLNNEQELIACMNEFARDMCKRQREICAENATGKPAYDRGNRYCAELLENEVDIDHDSIINSPLPEELL